MIHHASWERCLTRIEEIKRNIIVIKPDHLKEKICDDLENIEVICSNSEKELLSEWCNVINEYNNIEEIDYFINSIEKLNRD